MKYGRVRWRHGGDSDAVLTWRVLVGLWQVILGGNSTLTEADFGLLEAVEEKKIQQVADIIADVDWEGEGGVEVEELTSEWLSGVVMAASSVVWAKERKGEYANFDMLQAKHW